MAEAPANDIASLKIIYQEIVEGYSLSSDGKIYFRHFTDLDNITLIRQSKTFHDTYANEGIPTEEQRLKEAIANEEWPAQKEDDILSYRMSIMDNEKLLPSIIAQQQPTIRAAIERDKKAMAELIAEKNDILGTTVEELVARDMRHYSLLLSCYQDKELTRPTFANWSELESLDTKEIEALHMMIDEGLGKFNEKAIRRLSVLPIFLNSFSYAKDNITLFLHKPIVRMTTFQMFLCSCGQRNLSILSQSDKNPPEIIAEITLDDVVNWYDQQYSIILGKRRENEAK